jgi:hypothetical protein
MTLDARAAEKAELASALAGSYKKCTAPVRHGSNATVSTRPTGFVYQPRVRAPAALGRKKVTKE